MTVEQVRDRLEYIDSWEEIDGMRAKKYFGRGKLSDTLFVKIVERVKSEIVTPQGDTIGHTDSQRVFLGDTRTNMWKEA